MQSKAELDAFCAQCECIKICVEEIQTGKKFAEPPRRYI